MEDSVYTLGNEGQQKLDKEGSKRSGKWTKQL